MHRYFIARFLLLLLLGGVLGPPAKGLCATYGIKDADGTFLKMVTVKVGDKEITISKINPQERFQSISLRINPKNKNLVYGVGLLDIVWIGETGKPGKPARFGGPKYDGKTLSFKDTMDKSTGLKILDKSDKPTAKLFANKDMDQLFKIEINGEVCVSADSFESGRVVTTQGQDVSIYVSKSSLQFNEENLHKAEMLDVENRTSRPQVLGVTPPGEGLFADFKIVRKRAQTTIPEENWGRFTVDPNDGIFMDVVPNDDPRNLARLNGKEIRINVYEGTNVKEVKKIPIQVALELRLSSGTGGARQQTTDSSESEEPTRASQTGTTGLKGSGSSKRPEKSNQPPGSTVGPTGVWIWILQILNMVLLVGGAGYGIFFILPKIQVLEDRLAKNEMFIHGSREAIREELEQTKKEIFSRCLPPREPEIE